MIELLYDKKKNVRILETWCERNKYTQNNSTIHFTKILPFAKLEVFSLRKQRNNHYDE